VITQPHHDAPADADRVPSRTPTLRRLRALSGRAKIVLAAVVVLLAVALGVLLAAVRAPDRPAPPPLAKGFSLPALGQSGGAVSLARYAGRPVVLNFFASWCAPCQWETPLLATYYARQRGRVVIIGIDANDEETAALRFVHQAGVRYPVGFDRFPAPTTTSYGVYALPQTFFLDAHHHIVAKVMGAVMTRVLARDVALMNRRAGQV
jgi:cytochrome c biogenesis protein CcmG, thiol:disulfide interchange protein DsbE